MGEVPLHRLLGPSVQEQAHRIDISGTESIDILGPVCRIKHTEKGMLSMANAGPDTNGLPYTQYPTPFSFL